VSAKVVKRLDVANGSIQLELDVGFPAGTYGPVLKDRLTQCLAQAFPSAKLTITVQGTIGTHAVQQGVKR